MNEEKINELKQKLLQEKEIIELELTDIGARHSAVDWQATSGDLHVSPEDRSELADKSEEVQANIAIVENLEKRLDEIQKALDSIDNGEYGICRVCGNPIDIKRLEANPAARTCIEHAD